MKKVDWVFMGLLLTGCTLGSVGCGGMPGAGSGDPRAAGEPQVDDHSPGGHSHGAGPHDGTLADWGGGRYHVEFTVDHEQRAATVYIVGDDGKSAVAIEAGEIQLSIKDPAMQVTLAAAPQDGDPEGCSSRFVGNHEGLAVVQEYEGTISGVVDGTPYAADFIEEPHDGHEP